MNFVQMSAMEFMKTMSCAKVALKYVYKFIYVWAGMPTRHVVQTTIKKWNNNFA